MPKPIADALHVHRAKNYQAMTRLDFDADGQEEIEITSPKFAALIKPAGGGTIEVLDFRPSAVTLINSLERRAEAYHSRLQHASESTEQVASIHSQTLVKEAGLEKRLKYDRWPRNAFRLLIFSDGKTHADYEALTLAESAAFAGGQYRIERVTPEEVNLVIEAPLCNTSKDAGAATRLRAAKTLKFRGNEEGFTVTCGLHLTRLDSPLVGTAPAEAQSVRVGPGNRA